MDQAHAADPQALQSAASSFDDATSLLCSLDESLVEGELGLRKSDCRTRDVQLACRVELDALLQVWIGVARYVGNRIYQASAIANIHLIEQLNLALVIWSKIRYQSSLMLYATLNAYVVD